MEASPRSLRPELSAELLGWKVALFLAWHGSVNFCGHLEIGALSLSFSDDLEPAVCVFWLLPRLFFRSLPRCLPANPKFLSRP